MGTETVVEAKVYRKVVITNSEPSYGDILDLKEFFELLSLGVIIPEDGDGFFMIGNDVTDISVWYDTKDISPEVLKKIDKVLWLNK